MIAGPTATRFLAAHGADVLRIDPPGFAGGRRGAAADDGRQALRGARPGRRAGTLRRPRRRGRRPGGRAAPRGVGPARLRRRAAGRRSTRRSSSCATTPTAGTGRGPAGVASTAWCRCPAGSPRRASGSPARPVRSRCRVRPSTTPPATSSPQRCAARSTDRVTNGAVTAAHLALASTAGAVDQHADTRRSVTAVPRPRTTGHRGRHDGLGAGEGRAVPGRIDGIDATPLRPAGPLGRDTPSFS